MAEPRILPPAVIDAGYSLARHHIGRFNLALFGLTGVGKSTLLNAIFGEDLAETGIGEPVTRGSRLYRHHSSTLGVFDTKGLELGDSSERTLAALRRFVEQNRIGAVSDQIHVIWYCLRAGDRRIQPGEDTFIRQVATMGIPVLLVMTQTPLTAAGRPHPDAERLASSIRAHQLPIAGDVHFVNARADPFGGTPAHGLDGLLDSTSAVAPAGVRSALAAAQVISARQKRIQAGVEIDRSERAVSGRVFLKGLGTSWAELFASIAEIYGMPEGQSRRVLDEARTLIRLRRMLRFGNSGLLVMMLAPTTAIGLGRQLLRRRRGEEPGEEVLDGPDLDQVDAVPVGWVDEDTDPSVTEHRIGTGFAAGQVTRALGESWVETCEHFWAERFPSPPSSVTDEEIAEYFADQLYDRLPALMQRWEDRERRRREQRGGPEARD